MLLSDVDLKIEIRKLRKYYLPISLDESYTGKREKLLKQLHHILTHTTRPQLQKADFGQLFIGSLSVFHYFRMRSQVFDSCYKRYKARKKFSHAESKLSEILDRLLPEKSELTLNLAFAFFTNTGCWSNEDFVTKFLEMYTMYSKNAFIVLDCLLSDIAAAIADDIDESRFRLKVLYELLNHDAWKLADEQFLSFFTRTLDLFALALASDSKAVRYPDVGKAFEVCLCRLFDKIKNENRNFVISTMLEWLVAVKLTNRQMVEISSLIEYAAKVYTPLCYSEFNVNGNNLFVTIVETFLKSENHMFSLIGCRLIQNLLDRHGNFEYFLTPSIFYEYLDIPLVVGEYVSENKVFISEFRELLHNSLLTAVANHSHRLGNLKALFAVICIVMLEIPCGFTAALSACLAMAIQQLALDGENLGTISRYWLHAIVVSIISLLCWIHKAPTLYRYLNQIVLRRSKEAPHLIPPLLPDYNISYDHVTWNKPSLYFEDWELRYGLWKHFRGTPVSNSLGGMGKETPVMSANEQAAIKIGKTKQNNE